MIDVPALLSLLDDEALMRKYLERFTADMPTLLQQMRTAYQAQRWNEITIHAHNYKCQMQYIHEPMATSLAYELEIKSASPVPEASLIDHLITQLEYQLGHTLAEIQRIIE